MSKKAILIDKDRYYHPLEVVALVEYAIAETNRENDERTDTKLVGQYEIQIAATVLGALVKDICLIVSCSFETQARENLLDLAEEQTGKRDLRELAGLLLSRLGVLDSTLKKHQRVTIGEFSPEILEDVSRKHKAVEAIYTHGDTKLAALKAEARANFPIAKRIVERLAELDRGGASGQPEIALIGRLGYELRQQGYTDPEIVYRLTMRFEDEIKAGNANDLTRSAYHWLMFKRNSAKKSHSQRQKDVSREIRNHAARLDSLTG